MKCYKCGQLLPEDSEFCQYCGEKIENEKLSQEEIEIEKEQKNSEKAKKIKNKYCSRCGSVIDDKTKKCTGCGKQYFKGIKLNKFSITVLILSVVILASVILNIVQTVKINELNKAKEYWYGEYTSRTDDYNKKASELSFYELHVEVVGDDGTNTYHKYGCSLLDTSDGFWIYNSEAAANRYKKCWLCH